MSKSEVERFSKDLKSKPDLMAKVKPQARGLASVVSLAAQNGYHFSLEDAKQYIKANSPQPLNDQQLDAIAGAGVTAINTNVQVNAEVAVNAVTAQTGAAVTDVAVAAVVVLI